MDWVVYDLFDGVVDGLVHRNLDNLFHFIRYMFDHWVGFWDTNFHWVVAFLIMRHMDSFDMWN
jgi:hypothetical protein